MQSMLPDRGRVTGGKGNDELMRIGLTCRGDDLCFARAGTSEPNVLGNRCMEQKDVLADEGNLLPQGGDVDRANIYAVDRNVAVRRIVEALDQGENRGFAAP